MTGETSNEKEADKTSQEIADLVKEECSELMKESFDKFEVISYKTQVVSGMNYFLKVNTGKSSILVVKVWSRPWLKSNNVTSCTYE
jgi:cystatin-A/B